MSVRNETLSLSKLVLVAFFLLPVSANAQWNIAQQLQRGDGHLYVFNESIIPTTATVIFESFRECDLEIPARSWASCDVENDQWALVSDNVTSQATPMTLGDTIYGSGVAIVNPWLDFSYVLVERYGWTLFGYSYLGSELLLFGPHASYVGGCDWSFPCLFNVYALSYPIGLAEVQ